MKIKILKRKKSWEPVRICLLNSTANSAQFWWHWAGLAVLFSRQILNGSQDFFFLFNILIFIYLLKYETIETHARAFLTHNIFAIGRVQSLDSSKLSLAEKFPLSVVKLAPSLLTEKNGR